MRKLLIICFIVVGCAPVYKAPIKVVRGITPPVVFPVTKATAKVAGNVVKESVLLPVRIVKDSVKTKKHGRDNGHRKA
jgi:hypothetical protein